MDDADARKMERPSMTILLDPDDTPNWTAALWQTLPPWVLAGVNQDDCAVLNLTDSLIVITTDFVNANPILSQIEIGGLWDIGRLAVAANLSDLCGSGAEPRALLIGVMLPRNSMAADFEQVMLGVQYEAARWGIPVVGGDTKLGRHTTIFGVAIGSAQSSQNLFLQNRAIPGDVIWVSGFIGSCTAAVLGLNRNDMSDDWLLWAKSTILQPNLPVSQSRLLSQSLRGRGGTDISDGLGADLANLCRASGVGAIINAGTIPIEESATQIAEKMGVPPWALAFGIGGDFQFVVTTSPENPSEIESLGFVRIGEITEDPRLLLSFPGGRLAPLPIGGHRDAKPLSFTEEARALVEYAALTQEA